MFIVYDEFMLLFFYFHLDAPYVLHFVITIDGEYNDNIDADKNFTESLNEVVRHITYTNSVYIKQAVIS